MRLLVRSAAAMSALFALVGLAGPVRAQTPYQTVPVLTDAAVLSLSNQFGVPSSSAMNTNGDLVFVGRNQTGIFYRAAGASSIIRVIQYGDEIPGVPGSRMAQTAGSPAITPNGVAIFRVEMYVAHRVNTAILSFDGTTLTTVVSGLDIAPNSGGAAFDRSTTFQDLNSHGDVLINTPLLPLGSTATARPSTYFKPVGGAVVRVAGYGDVDPNTGGTFTSVVGLFVDNSGQVLFRATLTGGSTSSAFFAWRNGQPLRKIIANGDVNPLGGTFTENFGTQTARMNYAGLVMFPAGGSLWQNTEGGGTSVAVAAGSAAPAPMGGTFTALTIGPLGQGGDLVFTGSVTGGASASGLFRFRPGNALELVARVGEPAPNFAANFNSLTSPVVNASGAVAFYGAVATFGTRGIYVKSPGGALTTAIDQFADVPSLDGDVHLRSAGFVLADDGAILTRENIVGAPEAFHALIRWSPLPQVLMSTMDLLPPGARMVVRPQFLTAAGDYVGGELLKAGGRNSFGILSPSSQSGEIVATDGDLVAPSGGFLNTATTTMGVSPDGRLVALVTVTSGNQNQFSNAIVAGGLNTPAATVVAEGMLDSQGRVLTSLALGVVNPRPASATASGVVAFSAVVNTQRGIFVGTPGGIPQKVALAGDVTSTGAALTGNLSLLSGIGAAGQVLFNGTTSGGAGLFVATAGTTPVKVVQVGDVAPGGGTFSSVSGPPAFNNAGQVAFVATVSGGSGGGVFLASLSGPTTYTVEAIALNGAASPAGGTLVITTARADAVLNDAGDVAFIADLASGPDSGIFLKRSGQGLEAVAAQGQSAPGTAGQFSTFAHGLNNLVGEVLDVSAAGAVAFRAFVTPAGQGQIAGYWHRETSGALQPMVLAPSTPPAFEGGTVAALPSLSNWMSGDRFPLWIAMANGPRTSGIYLYVPVLPGAVTAVGTSVSVSPADAVTGASATVTFAQVTAPGETSLTRMTSGPELPRGQYRAGTLAAFYEISTTATVSGPITVCIDFADQDIPAGAVLRLLHYENGSWVDVTSSGPTGTVICGTTTSLSPFVVAMALNEPSANIVQNGTFASGSANWQTFASRLDEFFTTISDPSYIVWGVNNGVFEYYRVAPTAPDKGSSAVVLQNTGVAFAAGAPIVAHFDVGNTTSARKRVSVLIHDRFFGDLSVCTFWLPPNTPMRTYAMRTHTTIAWTDATISFYAASAGPDGGVYQLDNVVMGPGHDLTLGRTDCVDPGGPAAASVAPSPSLLTNGDFSNGLTNWSTPFTIETQVVNGVANFRRPSNTPPSGVLLQPTGQAVAAGQVLTATFRLGNNGGLRMRVTVLLHDLTFGDLAACTFWVPSGPSLSTYAMRAYTTQAWSNATIAFYPATTTTVEWLQLDDVALHVTPSTPTYGTDCVEPNDDSGLSGAPEPEAAANEQPWMLLAGGSSHAGRVAALAALEPRARRRRGSKGPQILSMIPRRGHHA